LGDLPQRDTLIGLLWNASVENKKIANISFKQPYDVLSKIENKSDFSSVRKGWDALGMVLITSNIILSNSFPQSV